MSICIYEYLFPLALLCYAASRRESASCSMTEPEHVAGIILPSCFAVSFLQHLATVWFGYLRRPTNTDGVLIQKHPVSASWEILSCHCVSFVLLGARFALCGSIALRGSEFTITFIHSRTANALPSRLV